MFGWVSVKGLILWVGWIMFDQIAPLVAICSVRSRIAESETVVWRNAGLGQREGIDPASQLDHF
ncbi:MAG: hypothetical protein EAZ30_09610 [Betaproteobacteria bacterium]|nr:MAG: hypothetical protein EAZ43_06915 [Betaproteobacteria bacterium]TAG47440.1 MAG: hypothetical protein EAZ30_09610 [Betaproteobacteria bacterium]